MSERPAPVRITDLERPEFAPDVVAVLDGMAALGRDVDFTAVGMLAAAQAQTGLDDFGPDTGWRDGLDAYVDALTHEAPLSDAGRLIVHTQNVQLLANRLKITDFVARNPAVHDVEIAAPIVIVGLPRTGTTHLHNVLAADPALRSLPYWESIEPVPPRDGPDERRALTEAGLWLMDAAMPYFVRMHEMTVDHVHEEIQLLAIDCNTMLFETTAVMPSWRDHYLAHDVAPSYDYLRLLLQVCAYQRGVGQRWVLKSPQHLEQIPALLHAFPDAVVVCTHRDPASVVASYVTMAAYTARLNHQSPIDIGRIGAYWRDRILDLYAGLTRDRDRIAADRSIDIRFSDFMADETAILEAVYSRAGQPFDDRARAAIAEDARTHPRGRHGTVEYDLAEFGLDADEIRHAAADYITRFDVPLEGARVTATLERAGQQKAGALATTPAGSATLRYVPGIDGLRALSVLAVMAFHYRPDRTLLRGGYLGVEVFFVISGYLITSLLLQEQRAANRIDFRAFWTRRIRRLWPALFAMVILTGLFLMIFHYDEIGRLKGDLFFGFYGENWWHIFHGVSYFELDPLSATREPFQHLWSLAVEEQFYVLWPLEIALAMFFVGRKRLPWVIVGQAVIGYGLAVSLAANGSTNAAYLSTFTRMAGLLVGSALACVWTPRRLRGAAAPNAGRVLDAAAGVAFVGLMMLVATMGAQGTGLYYWGLLLTDLLTVVLIAAIMHPAARANRVFGMRPLRWVGLRSYGIYLWGITIFEFTRPGIDFGAAGVPMFVLRLVLVVAATEVSYRFLELPIRTGAIQRALQRLRLATGEEHERLLRRWQVGSVVGALVVATLFATTGFAEYHENREITDNQTSSGCGDAVLKGGCVITLPSTTQPPVTTRPLTTTTRRAGTVVVPITQPTGIDSGAWRSSAVGDSVLLGAQRAVTDTLQAALSGPVVVNAAVSRQAAVCVDVLRALRDQHALGPLVIVHCGNNGTMSDHFVDQVMGIAGPRRHVVFATLKVPRGWEGANNDKILAGAQRYGNARVYDWHAIGLTLDPNVFFYKDLFHLRPPGRQLYAQRLLAALHAWRWA